MLNKKYICTYAIMFLHCLHGTSDDKQDYQKKTHPNVKILEKYKKPEIYKNFSEAIREVMRADDKYRTFIENHPNAYIRIRGQNNHRRISNATRQKEEDMSFLEEIIEIEPYNEYRRALNEEYIRISDSLTDARNFLKEINPPDINPKEEGEYSDVKNRRQKAFDALSEAILPETKMILSVISIIFQTNSAKVSENALPSADIEIWKNIGDFGAISQVCKDFNQASVHEFFNYYLAKYCQGKLFKDIKPYLLLKNKNLLKADNQFDRTLEIMEKKLLKDSDFDIIRDIIYDVFKYLLYYTIRDKEYNSIELKSISAIKNRDGMDSSIDQLKDALLQYKRVFDDLKKEKIIFAFDDLEKEKIIFAFDDLEKEKNRIDAISRYEDNFKQTIHFLNILKKKFKIDNPNSSSSSSSK